MSIAEKLLQLKDDFDAVYHAGRRTGQIGSFWDAYQANGARNNYNYAFAGYGWTDETFVPKYDIVPTSKNAKFMFANCQIVDLESALAKSGHKLDLSQAESVESMFSFAYCKYLPELDISLATSTSYMFNNSKAVTIAKLTVSEATVLATNMFAGATFLENLVIDGTIANSINLGACKKLNYRSLANVVMALSTTVSGLAVTLSAEAVDTAFETSEGAADGRDSEAWLDIESRRPDWHFVYDD